jgi:N-acetylmuramoyl-L-alanine amidase
MKNSIIVHCTDTPHTMKVTTKDLYDWHVLDNGWTAIGYAYFIDQFGDIHKCRDLDSDGDVEDEVGAHAKGHNRHSIGICLEGRGTYRDDQWSSLRYLINDIVSRHGIQQDKIIGHNDVDPHKECPMFNVQDKLKEWL